MYYCTAIFPGLHNFSY